MDSKKSLAYQLIKLHLTLTQPLQNALRPVGITVKNFNVMQLIYANPGIHQNALAELMQKDKTLIGQVVDKLEEKNLAKRESVKNDRRVYALFLTKEGERVLQTYAHIPFESEEALLAPLSASDKDAFRRILTQLIEQI